MPPGSPASFPQDGRPVNRTGRDGAFVRLEVVFDTFFGDCFLRFAELKVRVLAAMSSGEGAEEATKDAGDIAAFVKPGKPGNG